MAAAGSISGVVQPVTAHATVSAILEPDTIRAFADTVTGTFTMMGLPEGSYSVVITPGDTLLADTTIAPVLVVAQQETNLGTVVLHAK
jgi:hypothetical protein